MNSEIFIFILIFSNYQSIIHISICFHVRLTDIVYLFRCSFEIQVEIVIHTYTMLVKLFFVYKFMILEYFS